MPQLSGINKYPKRVPCQSCLQNMRLKPRMVKGTKWNALCHIMLWKCFSKVFWPQRYVQTDHLKETLTVIQYPALQLEKDMTKPQPCIMLFKCTVKGREAPSGLPSASYCCGWGSNHTYILLLSNMTWPSLNQCQTPTDLQLKCHQFVFPHIGWKCFQIYP